MGYEWDDNRISGQSWDTNKLPIVGGFNPLKNMSSSDWIIIPTIGENKIHVPNHQPDFPSGVIHQMWRAARKPAELKAEVSHRRENHPRLGDFPTATASYR